LNILCTICARGGSKGVLNKNIRDLLGKPLIAYTIKQALSSKRIGRVVVSTDSEEIAAEGKRYGAEVPFLRPSALAQDHSPKLPVLKHAVNYYIEEMKYSPDVIIDLDPTSPLRKAEDIEGCLDLILNDPHCDSIITGYRSNKNPYFNMIEIGPEGYAHLCKSSEKNRATRRQDAPAVYTMNASIYVWRTPALLAQNHVISGKVRFFEMPEERSIDIDTEIDFKLVTLLLKERG